MKLFIRGLNIYKRNWLLLYGIYRNVMTEKMSMELGDRMDLVVDGMMGDYRVL